MGSLRVEMKGTVNKQENLTLEDVLATMESALRFLDSEGMQIPAAHLSMAIETLKDQVHQSKMD